MTLNEAVERQKEPLLQTLCESIRIRSVQQPAQEGAPYGPGVQQCLEHALAAARALVRNTDMSAEDIAVEALNVAASICVYTNDHITVETL